MTLEEFNRSNGTTLRMGDYIFYEDDGGDEPGPAPLLRGAGGSARSRRGGVRPRRVAGRGGLGRCGGAHAGVPASACSSAERSGDVSAMYSARRSMSSAGFAPTLRTE